MAPFFFLFPHALVIYDAPAGQPVHEIGWKVEIEGNKKKITNTSSSILPHVIHLRRKRVESKGSSAEAFPEAAAGTPFYVVASPVVWSNTKPHALRDSPSTRQTTAPR